MRSALVQPYLDGLAHRVLGPDWPEKSVSDLRQQTLIRAWEKLSQFAGGQDDAQTGALLRAWLARTLCRLHSNDVRFHRAARRRHLHGAVSLDAAASDGSTGPGLQIEADDSTPSAGLKRKEARDAIQEAMTRLGPDERRIVELRFFEERSFRQIAQELGRDESTVRYRFQCILEQLGQDLKDWQ